MAVSEARMEPKSRERSEKDFSAIDSRRSSMFYLLRRQKRPSRRPEWSESGARRLKRTSQLLIAGDLACFTS